MTDDSRMLDHAGQGDAGVHAFSEVMWRASAGDCFQRN